MARRAASKGRKKESTTRGRKRTATSKGTESSSKKSAAASKKSAPEPQRREVLGVLALALGVVLALAVWSFRPRDAVAVELGERLPHNLIGPVGHHLADALLGAIGVGSMVVALALVAVSLALFARRRVHVSLLELTGYLTLVLSGAVLAHLVLPDARPFHHAPGGVVGVVAGETLRSHLNTVGAVIASVAVVLLALLFASDFTVARAAAGGWRLCVGLVRRSLAAAKRLWARHLSAREVRHARREKRRAARAAKREEARVAAEAAKQVAPKARDPEKTAHGAASPDPTDETPEALDADPAGRIPVAAVESPLAPEVPAPPPLPAIVSGAAAIAPAADSDARPSVDPLLDPNHADPVWTDGLPGPAVAAAELAAGHDAISPAVVEAPSRPEEDRPSRLVLVDDETPVEPAPKPAQRAEEISPAADAEETAADAAAAHPLPTIVEVKQPPKPKRRKAQQEAFAFTTHGEKFVLPKLDLLDSPPEDHGAHVDRSVLHETANKLTRKLADFGIAGEVQKIRLGPVVTMYEFVPGPGVKISKIAGLADDLAMAMEALRVRIVAPLPGKGAVGIEVPNKERQTVFLREILEQDAFTRASSRLTLGMGKDVEGMPFVVDLAKMPHLLIAGTTGSGKSVSVNAMITSILFRATPDQVRFIMVDPKWTELSLYEGIPHLLLPVVKDPTKAALALRWAVDEMERRYQLLADYGVRSLAGFNREAVRRRAEWEARESEREPLPPLETEAEGTDAFDALKRAHEDRMAADPPPADKLPLIVIIIDELADLMMVASREVETYIARIAQKARAAGIHLMVATQRPSTDVLTGLIKVNFPARVGFRVASRHDSQTIINMPGSEKLLGMGDMLIIPPGQSDPLRVHGAFVADDEIKRVVEHLKHQGEPIYDDSILKPREEEMEGGSEDDDDYDPKWDEAVFVVSERDSISVSMLQRKLKIGYNRAARMIERMEREGIVGPADGTKPRDVLITAPPAASSAAP